MTREQWTTVLLVGAFCGLLPIAIWKRVVLAFVVSLALYIGSGGQL